MLLLPVSLVVAELFYNRNLSRVTSTVIRLSKMAILMCLLISLTLAFIMYDNNFNIVGSYVVLTLVYITSVAISLLPIVLYKRFNSAWIACLPTVVLVIVAGIILGT